METQVISSCLFAQYISYLVSTNLMWAELLITSYYNIIKRLIIDVVPKSISYSLVGFAKDNIQKELLQQLYKPEVLDTLLKESDHVVNRRNEVKRMLTALEKAEAYVMTFTPHLETKLIAFLGIISIVSTVG